MQVNWARARGSDTLLLVPWFVRYTSHNQIRRETAFRVADRPRPSRSLHQLQFIIIIIADSSAAGVQVGREWPCLARRHAGTAGTRLYAEARMNGPRRVCVNRTLGVYGVTAFGVQVNVADCPRRLDEHVSQSLVSRPVATSERPAL